MVGKHDKGIVLGVGVLVALVVVNGLVSYRHTKRLDDEARWVSHTREVQNLLEDVLASARDAETGVRGLALTEDETYLKPYRDAAARVGGELDKLQERTKDNERQQARLPALRDLVGARLAEAEKVVAAYHDLGPEAARRIIKGGAGRDIMVRLRNLVAEMKADEEDLLRQRVARTKGAFEAAVAAEAAGVVLGLFAIAAFVWMMNRHLRSRAAAAEAIHKERELLRATLASIGDGVIATDAGGNVTFLNGVAEGLTGWPSDEAGGRPLETVFDIVNESTREKVENPALRALSEGVVVGLANHTVLRRRGGGESPIDDSAAPIRAADGAITGAVLVFRDVTERRRQEGELADREAQFRSLAESIPQLAWMAEADGRIFWYNRRWFEYTGTTLEQMQGWGWQAVHDPEVLPGVVERWRESLAQGKPFEMVFPLKGADGAFRPFLTRVEPVRDESGRVVRWFGANTDVSEIKRAEEALRESEARFRQIADTMPQIVWVTRPDGYHEYYNRRWYDYIGASPEDSMGEGWSSPLHPEDRERSRERWEHSLRTGEPYEIEYRFRSKDGEYRWFLGRALPVRDGAGRIVRWFGTCTDIDDYKRLQAERQKFVSLAENSTDFIAMWDESGRLDYVNKAGRAMVGLAAAPANVGDLFFPEDREHVVDRLLPAFTREGHGEDEVRFRNRRTGQAVWVTFKVFRLNDPRGKSAGLATVSRDITQRRQLEDDLRQLAADLSEADRRKDEFLATLAHELRNPLAPISNGLQLLKVSGNAGQAVEQARGMMERQLSQMVRLVDDLLDVSRITRNKLELRRERVDLASVLESAVETSRPLIHAARHRLAVSPPGEPILLDADPTRLAQVFSNLLNNAAKYTLPGGEIALTARREGGEAVVSVRDSGEGIPEEMLARVFEMFTQVDRTLERSQGGLGIGLTLVRRLVEMHGGSVEARSEGTGKGSEFTVRLPVAEGARAIGEPAPPRRASSRRVLVVDDNADSAASLAMLLEMMGHKATTAHDGLAAVEAARATSPEVIVLDIGLPRLNGYEACRRIRDLPGGERPLIVACTGWGQDDDRRRSRESGFDFHLTKPVDPAVLERYMEEGRPSGG